MTNFRAIMWTPIVFAEVAAGTVVLVALLLPWLIIACVLALIGLLCGAKP